ncbi:ABC transporter substrate-binding protein [Herbiconiux sp. CPCC 203407]|uniref:ABC transporter substrate-binding protein n=1 Tax=Herbiconiux oxytropis TaxID=2970915 RepID=A0AA41XIN0_9MICO|nr:ABC transporter substrate-binding protein [Herbiconiux oxytropis]MCS5721740.1 ABC transporter substrate-binding protein [Herbiconiux oxytropis]MCS5726633.1 ABC transporter substrate-binding protein [Herbiconiux oxytropis]
MKPIVARSGAAVAVAASFVLLAGCVSSAPAESDSTSSAAGEGGGLTIGVVMAETGFMSPFDIPALNTIKMEVDAVNEAGGIDGAPIELNIVDTGSDLDQYASAAQEVIDAGADVIVVTCDYDVASPASLVAEAAGILNIAPCVGDTIYGPAGGLELGFSMGNGTPGESSVMAEFAVDEGWKNAVFLTDTSIKYTVGQCDVAQKRFEELGGTTVGTYDYVQGESIVETVSQITAGTAPDVVFNCGYSPGGAQAAKDLRDNGVTAPIVSGFGMDGTFWLDSVPGLSDYYTVTYSSIMGDDPNAAVNELADGYEAEYGERPSVGSFVTGTSTVQALVAAHETAGSWDGKALADAFLAFDGEDLLVGPTSFTDELHINVERPQRVMKITGGELAFLEERAPEKVVFVD